MKFIFFGNENYNHTETDHIDKFTQLTKSIDCGKNITRQNQNSNSNILPDLIIYGGNFTNPNYGNKSDNIGTFIEKIKLLPRDIKKLILFGNYDMQINNNNKDNPDTTCQILSTQLEFYKANPYYEIFNNLTWNHIPKSKTIIIMFEN